MKQIANDCNSKEWFPSWTEAICTSITKDILVVSNWFRDVSENINWNVSY